MSNNQFGKLLLAVILAVAGGVAVARDLPARESEVAFSPGPAAEDLVVKVIDAARVQVRLLAYSFTSAPVTSALLRARKRHVDVALVVDHKHNLVVDKSGKARAALAALVNAGATVRSVSSFAIHHDKVIVVDGTHVQTGSFNYSGAAARSNSENVLVIWGDQVLAAKYLEHWQRNWRQGADYVPAY